MQIYNFDQYDLFSHIISNVKIKTTQYTNRKQKETVRDQSSKCTIVFYFIINNCSHGNSCHTSQYVSLVVASGLPFFYNKSRRLSVAPCWWQIEIIKPPYLAWNVLISCFTNNSPSLAKGKDEGGRFLDQSGFIYLHQSPVW